MKKIKITFVAAVSAVIFAGPLRASDEGTAAAQILKLGAGSRPAAMGDAYAADSTDAEGLFYNPAGLAAIKGGEAYFTHSLLVESIGLSSLAAAVKTEKLGVIAAGAQYLTYGDIDSTNNNGEADGSYSPKDVVATLGWAQSFGKKLSLGAAVKYISLKISGTASAFAGDVGARWKEGRLSLGAVYQNLGTKIKFNSESEKLPANLKAGAAYALKNGIKIMADANIPNDADVWFGGGAEWKFKASETVDLALRAGYTNRYKDTGGFNGLTTGVGVNLNGNLGFEYSFVPMGDLGTTHRLGIKYRWGRDSSQSGDAAGS